MSRRSPAVPREGCLILLLLELREPELRIGDFLDGLLEAGLPIAEDGERRLQGLLLGLGGDGRLVGGGLLERRQEVIGAVVAEEGGERLQDLLLCRWGWLLPRGL